MHKISPVGSLLTHKIYPNQLFTLKLFKIFLLVICTYIHVNKYITLVSFIFIGINFRGETDSEILVVN